MVTQIRGEEKEIWKNELFMIKLVPKPGKIVLSVFF